MASESHRTHGPGNSPERCVSAVKSAAVMPEHDPLVIRVTTDTGAHIDYLPYFPVGATVAEPVWLKARKRHVSHIVFQDSVYAKMRLRWPDVELVPESESLFTAEGDDAQ